MRHLTPRGQALVEFALVAPLFIFVLAGIIIFGIGVFNQQQVTNAAREAARFAAIHSATSQCPTRSWVPVNQLSLLTDDFELDTWQDCDPPNLGWPQMTAHARSKVFGVEESQVSFSACWSGYWEEEMGTTWDTGSWDAPAIGDDNLPNPFYGCTIGGTDPRTETEDLPCPAPATVYTTNPQTSDDKASNLSATAAFTANQVTVYACYNWTPPFIGDLVGGTVPLRAVITEAMQHQR